MAHNEKGGNIIYLFIAIVVVAIIVTMAVNNAQTKNNIVKLDLSKIGGVKKIVKHKDICEVPFWKAVREWGDEATLIYDQNYVKIWRNNGIHFQYAIRDVPEGMAVLYNKKKKVLKIIDKKAFEGEEIDYPSKVIYESYKLLAFP